ncbi:MAG: pitrilysin family protein, partial [Patescibacteria group bacterium]|nr:pitrilysin family protein [Patescibacteria group bacterium]
RKLNLKNNMPNYPQFIEEKIGTTQLFLTPLNRNAATIQLSFDVGSFLENKNQAGISHFIEHLIFNGSKKYPSAQKVAQIIEKFGGKINGFTSENETTFWIYVPKSALHKTTNLLFDIVFNPLALFAGKEIEKEKKIILEEISLGKDNPDRHIFDLAMKTLNPKHKISTPVIGSKKTVKNIKKDDLINWWKKHYLSSNLKISIAGYIPKKIKKEIIKYLPREKAIINNDWPKYQSPKTLRIKNFYKKIDQVKLMMIFENLAKLTPKTLIMAELVEYILGGGMSSILFEELRTKKGLCYSVWAKAEQTIDLSLFTISGGFSAKKIKEATQKIIEVIQKIKDDGFTTKQFEEAKQSYLGSLEMKCDDTADLAFWPIFDKRNFNRIISFEENIKILEGISQEELNQFACNLFKKESLAFTTLGPYKNEEKIKEILNKLN